ncbi:MAG: stage II sporulation protein R [Ruminococcaceae bacterium]|nr:stage II sporulation protein R [Oscillospiraceae bacterium]
MASTKKLLICTFLILTLALIAGLFPVHGEGEIYDTVVRLHVLANSDSDEDQALKLLVRDRILEVVAPAVENCSSQSEAIAAIGGIMDEIELAAEEVVRAEGFDYDVTVEIGKEYYPTKTYESCAFPKGEYVSLRVCIGEAEGQNWWCCLFPTLCLSAARDDSSKSNEDAFVSAGLTSEQYKIITETGSTKYKIRFKILEAIQGIFK